MTATGHPARRTRLELTEPSKPRASAPPARAAQHHHLCLVGDFNHGRYRRGKYELALYAELSIRSNRLFGELDGVGDDLATLVLLPNPQVSGYGIGGHVATSAFTTWTTVSGMFLIAASVAPQQAAASDSSEPSTPTTTPCCLRGLDISFSLRLEQRYEPTVTGHEALVPNRTANRP